MVRPDEEDEERLHGVELAVLGHPRPLAREDVLVNGPVEERLPGEAQDLAQRPEPDAHRRAVAGEDVHHVDVQVVIAILVVVPPAVLVVAIEVGCGNTKHHGAVAQDGEVEAAAVPGDEAR